MSDLFNGTLCHTSKSFAYRRREVDPPFVPLTTDNVEPGFRTQKPQLSLSPDLGMIEDFFHVRNKKKLEKYIKYKKTFTNGKLFCEMAKILQISNNFHVSVSMS
jgi:hypothetical protein